MLQYFAFELLNASMWCTSAKLHAVYRRPIILWQQTIGDMYTHNNYMPTHCQHLPWRLPSIISTRMFVTMFVTIYISNCNVPRVSVLCVSMLFSPKWIMPSVSHRRPNVIAADYGRQLGKLLGTKLHRNVVSCLNSDEYISWQRSPKLS